MSVSTLATFGILANLAILTLFTVRAQSQTSDLLQPRASPALEQEIREIPALNKRVEELCQAGKYAEAIPVAP